jgi:HK97 family phage prohead protease
MADVLRKKVVQATIKQSPTDGSGRFVALVSTFGPPPDVQGDIISVGAFDETITQAYIDHPGALWPVWWMHDYIEPSAAIGIITAASATPKGLVVEGQLDLTNEKAMSVYQGMLEDRIREWSISYGVLEEHQDEWEGKPVNWLDRLELLEISSVMAGANRFTQTLQVKNSTTTIPFSTGSTTTTAVSWNAPRRTEDPVLAHYKSLLDGLETRKSYAGPAVDVDAFVTQVRQEMVEEALARAEQAAWQERMNINLVLASVPVRVDARMKPVTS